MNKWTDNEIGDEGKAHITEAVNVNSTLTLLRIWDIIDKIEYFSP